jgi:hypothetical protein
MLAQFDATLILKGCQTERAQFVRRLAQNWAQKESWPSLRLPALKGSMLMRVTPTRLLPRKSTVSRDAIVMKRISVLNCSQHRRSARYCFHMLPNVNVAVLVMDGVT